MNYLILEDDPKRIRLFRDHYNTPGNMVVVASSVKEAQERLEETAFDVISMDHDLDGRVYVPSEEPNTGYQLAKWVAENNIPFKRAVVHSYNELGAMKMVEILPGAVWEPFYLKEKPFDS